PWQGRALPLSYTRILGYLAPRQPVAIRARRPYSRKAARLATSRKSRSILPIPLLVPPFAWLRRGLPGRVRVAEAAVAPEHVGTALLDRGVLAVPVAVAGSKRVHRAPGRIAGGLRRCGRQAGGNRDGHYGKDKMLHVRLPGWLMIITPNRPEPF